MKMANNQRIPVMQFVADGDARFRKQMLAMSGYVPLNQAMFSLIKLEQMSNDLVVNGRKHGWILQNHSNQECFHFFVNANEMRRSNCALHIPSTPSKAFFEDDETSVKHYLIFRGASNVFSMSPPVIGRRPS